MILSGTDVIVAKAYAVLRRKTSNRIFPVFVGAVAFILTVSMTIPFASILVAAVFLRPERWTSDDVTNFGPFVLIIWRASATFSLFSNKKRTVLFRLSVIYGQIRNAPLSPRSFSDTKNDACADRPLIARSLPAKVELL